MINVSDAFKQVIQNGIRNGYLAEAKIRLLDGTALSIAQNQIWENGIEIESAVSDSDSFSIGSAIAGKLTLVLDNRKNEFGEYDFFGATVSIKIGVALDAETSEYIRMGELTVDDPVYGDGIITLECLDNMILFDRPYSESSLIYPATIGQIVRDACDVCGVPLLTISFDHDDYVVNARPNDSAITFRKVLSWAAQIACKWAKCNPQGQLELGWYNYEAIRGDVSEDRYHSISRLSSLNVTTDDVVITGIQVVEASDGIEESDSCLEGEEGYILSVEDNQLINAEDIATVAGWLGEQLIGLRFRPFTARHLSNPTIEAGDVVRIVGRRETYYSVVTSTTFSVNSYQESSCDAETPSRNSSTRYSESTKTYVALRKLVRDEKSARETAVENLAKTLANSSGLFMTTEEMGDGSFIYYAHNKPTMEESDIVWLFTAEAIGISTDGGKTYPYGFTVTGEMITSILQTDGINADWINSGCLTVKNSAGEIIFQADITTGKVIIDADSISIGGKAVATEEYAKELAEKATNLTVLLSNEYQSIPTDSAGNYTTFPECSTAIQVLYGQADITAQCTLTATTSAGVTGSLSGTTYKVAGLTADTGWVDIKATYLGTLTAVKRFTISKVKDGAQGSTVKILNTEISMTQDQIAANSANGHVRNWTVMSLTDGLKVGDSVMIQVYNSSKGGEAYILAVVNEVLSTYRINATSSGVLDKGETARTYMLESSVTMIKRGQDDLTTPHVVSFSSYYREGTSAAREVYSGRFRVEKTTDGNIWTTVYLSRADETSCKYFLSGILSDGQGRALTDGKGRIIIIGHDPDAIMFRCTLYAAGTTTEALDMLTVPVVIDVAALTHEQIFNLLTNDGTWQGIYYENGHMYISGQYVQFNGAKIGGWNIGESAIYKDVKMSDGTVYRVYFQPPVEAYPDGTWVLSCQKSTDGGKTFSGNFILYSSGSAKFGKTNIDASTGMIYSIANGHIIQFKPAVNDSTDVIAVGDYDEETNSYTITTYIQANGIFHPRKILIDNAPTYPHIAGDSHYLQLSHDDNNSHGVVIEDGMFRPPISGGCNLGSDVYLWGQIYSVNTAISLSDEREKNTINPLDSELWKKFFLGLNTVSYKFNSGTSGRLHHGMISQEVEKLLMELGIDSQDFAGFIKWQKTVPEEREELIIDDLGQKVTRKYYEEVPVYSEDGQPEYGYALRYEEFLPMTIKMVQELYAENQKLWMELDLIKKDMATLKQMIIKEE